MALVLLVVAAAGVLLPFGGAANEQAQGARETLAAQLASELLEKIAACPFDLIVSTYNGYTENKGGLRDSAGQVRANNGVYTGFSRYAVCEPVTAASVDMIRVTVVVLHDGAEVTRLTTLVGK